jgi:hypothetical protein
MHTCICYPSYYIYSQIRIDVRVNLEYSLVKCKEIPGLVILQAGKALQGSCLLFALADDEAKKEAAGVDHVVTAHQLRVLVQQP